MRKTSELKGNFNNSENLSGTKKHTHTSNVDKLIVIYDEHEVPIISSSWDEDTTMAQNSPTRLSNNTNSTNYSEECDSFGHDYDVDFFIKDDGDIRISADNLNAPDEWTSDEATYSPASPLRRHHL